MLEQFCTELVFCCAMLPLHHISKIGGVAQDRTAFSRLKRPDFTNQSFLPILKHTLPRFSRATIPLLRILHYLLGCFLFFVRTYFTESFGILEYASIWYPRRDSNSQNSDFESDTYTVPSPGQIQQVSFFAVGFEPTKVCLEGKLSTIDSA